MSNFTGESVRPREVKLLGQGQPVSLWKVRQEPECPGSLVCALNYSSVRPRSNWSSYVTSQMVCCCFKKKLFGWNCQPVAEKSQFSASIQMQVEVVGWKIQACVGISYLHFLASRSSSPGLPHSQDPSWKPGAKMLLNFNYTLSPCCQLPFWNCFNWSSMNPGEFRRSSSLSPSWFH